mmetsp:Transcript_33035/g.77236  ORF Transcript_33035/g.77236 Transcript_33035/m.77236 type:complete len:225 (-) Transcript_33035:1284-1958(-)
MSALSGKLLSRSSTSSKLRCCCSRRVENRTSASWKRSQASSGTSRAASLVSRARFSSRAEEEEIQSARSASISILKMLSKLATFPLRASSLQLLLPTSADSASSASRRRCDREASKALRSRASCSKTYLTASTLSTESLHVDSTCSNSAFIACRLPSAALSSDERASMRVMPSFRSASREILSVAISDRSDSSREEILCDTAWMEPLTMSMFSDSVPTFTSKAS